MCEKVQKTYKNNALITTLAAHNVDNHLSTLEAKARTKRQVKIRSFIELQLKRFIQTGGDEVLPPVGESTFADSDYPAMFSIILFVSLGLVLVVTFVVYGMWTTEDDKDSIIFRMTMPRQAKKDL